MTHRPYLPPDKSHPAGGPRGATAAIKEHGSEPRARGTYAASSSGVRFSSRGLARVWVIIWAVRDAAGGKTSGRRRSVVTTIDFRTVPVTARRHRVVSLVTLADIP